MTFLIYIIGILTGLILAVLIIKKERKIDYFVKKIEDIIMPTEKAEFFEAGSSEQDALEALYEEHKKKGIDTPL